MTPLPFFLEVTSPLDESVSNAATIQVTGKTTPDAVVSVNGNPVDIDADGGFTASVTLAEGINFVEVIASDFAGNSTEEVRTLIYSPLPQPTAPQ